MNQRKWENGLEFFHDQVSTEECADVGIELGGSLHAKRTRFRSRSGHAFDRATAPGKGIKGYWQNIFKDIGYFSKKKIQGYWIQFWGYAISSKGWCLLFGLPVFAQ